MFKWKKFRASLIFLAAVLTGLPSSAQFVEDDVSVTHLWQGNQVGDYFGWLTANIGDLDGDGIDDAAVGAIAFNGFAGRVAVFSGASGELLHEEIGAPGSALGYAVDAAGDVNGDGTPDYIVGGGQVLVISGLDHQVLYDFGPTTGFSDSVGGGRDFNHDGFDDVLVGTRATDISAPAAGRVWAFSGQDGALLFTADGSAEGALLGSAVGAVDDINRDGTPDIIAGAPGAGAMGGGEGVVLSGVDGSVLRTLRPFNEEEASIFGTFFASDAGDMDGDGVGDLFISDLDAAVDGAASTGKAYVFSGRTGFPIHVIEGLFPGEGFGLGRAVPDLNGDGRPDLVIGAFNNSRSAPGAGATYVFSGRSGALLRTITATTESDNFGGDATALGDVDGDGLPELLATAPGLSFLGLDAGRAFVIGGTVLPCPADLTGNGRVNFRDLLRLKRSSGNPASGADLNGDGEVDFDDIVVLLRDWGRCAPGYPVP